MYEFSTPNPVRLRLELGSGEVEIDATDTARTTVDLRASHDEASRQALADVRVEQRGDDIIVEAPRRSSFLRRGPHLHVRIEVPQQSQLDARLDSAELTTSGRLTDARVKSGSGNVRLDTVTEDTDVKSGSGDVEIERAGCSSKVQSGSGDVRIRSAGGTVTVGTGSGDVDVEHVDGATQLNSGSGDLRLGDASSDVTLNSASGDQRIGRVARGRLRSNSASGDVHVGIADDTAAWLSVNSLSGTVHSELDGSGPPAEGEDSVEVRINTVSGDITLVRA